MQYRHTDTARDSPKDHCQAGMVFAVNPNATMTFADFQAAAMNPNSTANAAGSLKAGVAGVLLSSVGLLAGLVL